MYVISMIVLYKLHAEQTIVCKEKKIMINKLVKKKNNNYVVKYSKTRFSEKHMKIMTSLVSNMR